MNREGDHWNQKKHQAVEEDNGDFNPGGADDNFIETSKFFAKVHAKLNQMTLAQLKQADPFIMQ